MRGIKKSIKIIEDYYKDQRGIMNNFKQLWEIKIPYFPKRELNIVLGNRNGRLELILWDSFKGLKGTVYCKNTWFYGNNWFIKLWRIK